MPGRAPASGRSRARGRPPYARRRFVTLVAFGVVAVLVVVAALGVRGWLRDRGVVAPLPGEERCVATVGDRDVVLDLDQAHYTSIVVGLSVRRELAPRAGSIAMATVYQETGIRNLDYGDRDSVGLFQQRPSQGWGTEKQLMDPYYATTKFYNALVRVRDWESRDITKVAQAVQRSAYPDAYRDHEPDARVLASALTGQTARAVTCLVHDEVDGDADGLAESLEETFRVGTTTTDKVVTVKAKTQRLAWAYAQYAVANAGRHGVVTVEVDDRVWTTDQFSLPTWVKQGDAGRTVRVTVR
ncbi:hypothetical protein [Microlunatus antarcticus]|uniref:Uncharacterized protein n=1 Tax=Microlunatus antarcticus TaxID=53388 RepID=A0A7W5JY58_9ACTN|nr:hypothetical protein [Microlunatus antarcticus]MBB3328497.1 hypothetical protein [Microlunatus antarcticus]